MSIIGPAQLVWCLTLIRALWLVVQYYDNNSQDVALTLMTLPHSAWIVTHLAFSHTHPQSTTNQISVQA
jgi:hypothetical protein